MKTELRILHLEDNPTDAELIRSMLEADDLRFQLVWVKTRAEFTAALLENGSDLVLSDYTLPSFDGLSALALAREKCPDTPFIFVSGTIGEEAAIEALRQGATDYLLKDRLTRLPTAIERAVREAAERVERKRLQNQLLRTQRLESIGALAAGITHDLNNALAPVLMGVEHLRGEQLTDMGRRILELMNASTLRSAQMVKQVLSFAHGVGGGSSMLNLKPLIREMEGLARQTFPRSIRIQTDVPALLHPVLGDATQLHQVLLNLCINARDAMPQGGSLAIAAKNVLLDRKQLHGAPQSISGDFIALTVSDTGKGIPPELQDKMFEPFFTTKARDQGTGLGLTTVRGIVKSHGGWLEMRSEVGKGASFTIYLPAAIPFEAPQPKADPDGWLMGNGEQILLVDDELTVLQMMRALLEASHYRVLTASHGAQALALCQDHKGEIQAVITDLMMPRMDGPTLIHALRETDPAIRIIGITGLNPNTELAKAGREASDAFLEKPFVTGDLLRALRGVMTEGLQRSSA